MALWVSTWVGHGSAASRNPSSLAIDLMNSTSVTHEASAMHSLSVDKMETARCLRV